MDVLHVDELADGAHDVFLVTAKPRHYLLHLLNDRLQCVELVPGFDPQSVSAREFAVDLEHEVVELLIQLPVVIVVLICHRNAHVNFCLIQLLQGIDDPSIHSLELLVDCPVLDCVCRSLLLLVRLKIV